MALFGLCVVESSILPLTPAHDYLFDADADSTRSYMRSHLLVIQLCSDCEVEPAGYWDNGSLADDLGPICSADRESMFEDDMDHNPWD